MWPIPCLCNFEHLGKESLAVTVAVRSGTGFTKCTNGTQT